MEIFLILSLIANAVLGAYVWHFYQDRNKWRKWASQYAEALGAQQRGALIGFAVGMVAIILRRIFSAKDAGGENGA